MNKLLKVNKPNIASVTSPHLTRLKSTLRTLVVAGFIGLFAAKPYVGYMLLLVVPILLPWFIYSAVVAWRYPDRRVLQLFKVGIWFVVIAGVIGCHNHYEQSARETADNVVSAVKSYHFENGYYPLDLSFLGDDIAFQVEKWRVYYSARSEVPSVFYRATHIVFDTYWYDFETSEWIYHVD